jgi:hypothetical protein
MIQKNNFYKLLYFWCLLVPLLLTSTLIKCQNKKIMEQDKYEWFAYETVPEGYSVEVWNGFLSNDAGKIVRLPHASEITGPWGKCGSIEMVGDDFKAIPTKLSLTWIAYTEKKCYTLEATLPSKIITDLFKEGYATTEYGSTVVHKNYNAIVIGMAPGGVVAVWVGLSNSTRLVEVAHYKAQETIITPDEYYKINENVDRLDQKQFYERLYSYTSDEIRNEITQNGIPYGLWDRYRTKNNWRCQMEFLGSQKARAIPLEMYNGEAEYLELEALTHNSFKPRAILKKIYNLSWIDDTIVWQTKVSFEEAEIFDSFKNIFEEHKANQAELVIKVSADNQKLDFILKSQHHEIVLKKVTYNVYSL